MRLIPPDVLFSWPTPNYKDPVTRGYALLVLNSIFITLVIIVVMLRVYTRIWIKHFFGADDVFIILALVFTVGLTTVVLLANQRYGWDRHVYDIPFTSFTATLKVAMAAKLLFTAAATFTRLSLLCFYLRLVQDSGRRGFHWAIHANLAYTIAIFITFIFLSIFQCHPVQNYWIYGSPESTCLNEGTVTVVAGIVNCVADFLCTITPIPLAIQLQLPRRQRIAVVVLFSLGFIVTIAGIVRTWYIYKSLIKEYDQTWNAYALWIAAAIEIDLGIICASAPVLRPLLSHISFRISSITPSFSKIAKGPYYTYSRSSNMESSEPTQQNSRACQSRSSIESKRALKPLPLIRNIEEARRDNEVENMEMEILKTNVQRSSKTPCPSREDAISRVLTLGYVEDVRFGNLSNASTMSLGDTRIVRGGWKPGENSGSNSRLIL